MNMLKHALEYAAQGFKVFPITPGAKKPPLIEWRNASSEVGLITKWWTQWPNANIGFAAGQSGFTVIDVDTKDGRNGRQTLAWLELEGCVLTPTRMQRTPSGGLHYFYKGECATTQNAIGRILYQGKNKSHIDTRGEGGGAGGYVLLAPSITVANNHDTKAGMYEWMNGARHAIAAVDSWVVEQCGIRQQTHNSQAPVVELDQNSNVKWYIHYLTEDAPDCIEGQGGEATLLQVMGIGKDHGLSEETIIELVDKYYNDYPPFGKCDPPWELDGPPNDSLIVKAHNVFAYLAEVTPGAATAEAEFGGEDIDKEYPLTQEEIAAGEKNAPVKAEREERKKTAGKQRVWTIDDLAHEFVYITAIDRFVRRDNRNIVLKPEVFDRRFAYCGRVKPKATPSHILMHQKHNTILKLDFPVFKPDEPEIIDGHLYNMYRPSNVVPKEGDTSVWDSHLEYLFPSQEDRDHVLNWCAWLIRNLKKKPKHALLIAGHTQGTGKSFIAEVLTCILGKLNVAPVGSSELSSTFNKWALGSKLILIEELRALDKREVAQKLHPLITQETVTINNKNEQTYAADTCFGIMAMTNDDAAVNLDNTDRRYLVLRTDASPQSVAYYSEIYDKLDDPDFIAAVAHQLWQRDMGEYDGRQRAPDTVAKQQMIQAGRSDFEEWLYEEMHNAPFNQDLVSVYRDIIPIVPPSVRPPNKTIVRVVSSFLRHQMKGMQLEKPVMLSDGNRVRLWALNGKFGILKGLAPPQIAKLYESRRQAVRTTLDDAADDFAEG